MPSLDQVTQTEESNPFSLLATEPEGLSDQEELIPRSPTPGVTVVPSRNRGPSPTLEGGFTTGHRLRPTSKGLPVEQSIVHKRKRRGRRRPTQEHTATDLSGEGRAPLTAPQLHAVRKLVDDLQTVRPDIVQAGSRAGATSDRPMDTLRALVALVREPPMFFSHCPKTFGPMKARFEAFSTSFQERLSFRQSKVQGHSRPTVSVRHTSQPRDIATWLIPPDSEAPDWEWHLYKECCQAGWEDNLQGIYVPGIRIDHEKVKETGFFSHAVHSDLEFGHMWRLRKLPPKFLGKNYSSWQDYPEPAEADFQALKIKRYIEGPLGYVPHIVNSLGMVLKIDATGKLKLRTCVDSSASGFNDSLEKVYTKLDQVVDAISHTTPNCWQSKIDLSDAFLQLPIEASHCDFMGFRNLKGEFWRYRFSPFGISLAPWLCQRFAYELQNYINHMGLQHVPQLLDDGSPNPAASYTGFRCTASYIDDHHFVHPAWLTKEQAAQQLSSVERVVSDLGVVVKPEKVEGPLKCMEFLGVDIDSSKCVVGVSERKSQRLVQKIEEFIASVATSPEVGRNAFAGLIGKLQFYAPYLQGAQGHLAHCYKDRDNFVDPTVLSRSISGR